MLDDEQKNALAKLPKITLINFVADVQGMDKLLDKKIERLLLQSDKPKLIKKLTSNLKGLRRRRKVLNYWENSDFVTELHYLMDDIMSLYPEQPESCLALLELLIASTDATMERVDDSKGDISDIYSRLTLLWLPVAASCYKQEKQTIDLEEQDILTQVWIEKVKAMVSDNDYGTKDRLLRNIDKLFSASEIKVLIEDYKYHYQTLITEVFNNDETCSLNMTSYSPMNANSLEKLALETALTDLAWALGDIATFEEIYNDLCEYRPLSKHTFDVLIRFMIEHGAYEAALCYLEKDKLSQDQPAHFINDIDRLDWLGVIYSQQDNKEAYYSVLLSAFELESSAERFRQIMTIASPAQQASLRKRVYELADQHDIMTTIGLWLEIGEVKKANQVAVARYNEFDELHYTILTEWLAKLKQLSDNTNLIRVIIYRSLLNDILDNGLLLAYGHAARYYKHLVKLDGFISRSIGGYTSLNTHQDYVKALKQTHGKKYSFWERV